MSKELKTKNKDNDKPLRIVKIVDKTILMEFPGTRDFFRVTKWLEKNSFKNIEFHNGAQMTVTFRTLKSRNDFLINFDNE